MTNLHHITQRIYLAGIQRGIVMGFCLGAIVVWAFK